MPSRWFWRAAFPLGLLGGGLAAVSLAPLRPSPSSSPHGGVPAERLMCARVGSQNWSPLPGVDYTGLLAFDLRATAHGAIAFIVADHLPLDIEARSAVGPLPLERQPLKGSTGIGIPPDLWLEAGGPWTLPPFVERITVRAPREHDMAIEMSLGRRAPRVLARLEGYPSDDVAVVCAARPTARPYVDGQVLTIFPESHEYFSTGWYVEEAGAQGTPVRWMRKAGVLLVPSEADGGVRIQLHASSVTSDTSPERPHVSLRVNDVWNGGSRQMTSGAADYEWLVPSETWVAGVNELLLSVSMPASGTTTGGRPRGLALHSLRVSP